MSRALAIIENGVVANVILADSWPGGIDVTDMTPRPGPGWTFDGQSFAPPTAQPDPGSQTTPLMTQEAFTSRMDFFDEFVPINSARKTDPEVDAAFVRFYGAMNVDVRLTLVSNLLGLLVYKGLLAPERIAPLLEPIALSAPGAIDPRTGAVTVEPFE